MLASSPSSLALPFNQAGRCFKARELNRFRHHVVDCRFKLLGDPNSLPDVARVWRDGVRTVTTPYKIAIKETADMRSSSDRIT